MRTCLICNKEYKLGDDGAGYKYCSEDCSLQARRNRNRDRWRKANPGWDKGTNKVCEWCGQPYEVLPGYQSLSKYCSIECQQTYHSRQKGHMPLEEWTALVAQQKQERQAKLEEERIIKKLIASLVKVIKVRKEEDKIKDLTRECEECGGTFYDPHPNVLTCSNTCSRKRKNRWIRLYNSTRLNETNIIDKDISLRKLYERDDGICYLCGGECDYHDHTVTLEGHYIAGPTYPSIDHVTAIANGGMHSWENVKLTHHRCNTLKKDTKLEEYVETLT